MTKKVILISGLSGAGKTSASSILEDMGYHCIDQYPVQLIDFLVDLIESSNDPRFQRVALTMPLQEYKAFEKGFRGSQLAISTLLLECNSDILLSRYKSTRRTHPLLLSNVANTLEECIQQEEEQISKIKIDNLIVIDTSFIKYKELKIKLEEHFSGDNDNALSITFLSFGYKHGVPLDADLMIDVRFLPNPYWESELRLYSGDDACVYNYVMEKDETKEFIKHFEDFLEYAIKQYINEGKNHLTVGIGCTGGQHRSVSITNYLYKQYKSQYRSFKFHRDRVEYHEE